MSKWFAGYRDSEVIQSYFEANRSILQSNAAWRKKHKQMWKAWKAKDVEAMYAATEFEINEHMREPILCVLRNFLPSSYVPTRSTASSTSPLSSSSSSSVSSAVIPSQVGRQETPLSSWTVNEVVQWTREIFGSDDVSQPYAQMMRDKEINGAMLSRMGPQECKLLIPNDFHRIRFWNELQRKINPMPEKETDCFTCKICFETKMNTIFQPCHHLVCCSACASQLTHCPMCRTSIDGRLTTFIV